MDALFASSAKTRGRVTSLAMEIRQRRAEAAHRFKPMTKAEIGRLRDACLAAGPTFCAACDGRCAREASTSAALGDLTRLLTYHDQYGYRGEARRR